MRITHLSITNFKNYARLELDLPAGTTVIHGENAQGKTSFLEAIYYLARIHSLGAQTDSQLINWVAQQSDLPYARLMAQVQRDHPPLAPQQFEIVLSQEALPANARWDNSLSAVPSNTTRLRKSLKLNGAS